eukprot:SAG31_NODE_1798_length_7243_cov_4.509518_5_plen_93_part_00
MYGTYQYMYPVSNAPHAGRYTINMKSNTIVAILGNLALQRRAPRVVASKEWLPHNHGGSADGRRSINRWRSLWQLVWVSRMGLGYCQPQAQL